MKTNHFHLRGGRSLDVPRRPRQEGMAVIAVMILVVIVLIYLAGNIRTLHNLGRDLRMIEQQQTQRLAVSAQATNTLAATNVPPAKTRN